MNYVVTVLCAAHLHVCPIPKGYHGIYKLDNKQQCIEQAKTVITTLGYATADFNIVCKEK